MSNKMNGNVLADYLDSVEKAGIPGCGCVVYHNHKPVFHHLAGYADSEKTRPITADTTYWLYSVSKIVTCTAVMQLIEKGCIGLDDPVYKYLPEYKDMMVKSESGIKPAEKTMTIRHLLTMQSGLNYNLNAPSIKKVMRDTNGQVSTREFVKALAQEPLDFEPGTRYQYSLSHDVLGAVVEAVSGKLFDQYVEEHIFKPLGMEDTGFELTSSRKERLSGQFQYNVLSRTSKPMSPDNFFAMSPNLKSGGAGLISSLDDFILFLDAMCNDGIGANGGRVLNAESIELMRTDQLSGESKKDFMNFGKIGYSYGLGVRTLIDKEVSGARSPLGEFGWDGAAGSYALIDAENHLAIFYVQHVMGCEYAYQVVHPKIRNLVYEMLQL